MCMSRRFIETAVKMFIRHAIWKPVSCEMWPVNLRRAMNVFVNVRCQCKPSVLQHAAQESVAHQASECHASPRIRDVVVLRSENGSHFFLRVPLSLSLEILCEKFLKMRRVVVNSLEFHLLMQMGLIRLIYFFFFSVNTAPLTTCLHSI